MTNFEDIMCATWRCSPHARAYVYIFKYADGRQAPNSKFKIQDSKIPKAKFNIVYFAFIWIHYWRVLVRMLSLPINVISEF